MIYGIGVDAVDPRATNRSIAEYGDIFLNIVFTDRENKELGVHGCSMEYATVFALKEAVWKSIGAGWAWGMTWGDIEISRKGDRYDVRLSGKTRERHDSLNIASYECDVEQRKELIIAKVISRVEEVIRHDRESES
jgi:holo-[acyl-carrier protein] synthase